MSDRLGEQLGNYRLVHFIGRGGFADVYLGEHIHLKTQAALKVLHTRLAKTEEDHFQQEAYIIARLVHPNIVRILDFALADGVPFLVMDYAPHGTLRTLYPRGAPLPPNTILPYVKQVASALQYAHDQKVIHRDIKPENMLVGPWNEVLLSDFGIAVVTQSSRSDNPADVAGTVMYMAPEQIQAQPLPASDQYALGVVVYEWLTGHRLFDGPYNEVAIKHAVTAPPSLRSQLPNIPSNLEDVVMTALAKDPAARFGNMQAFANAFEQACQDATWWQFTETQVINLSAPSVPSSPAGQITPVISSSQATPVNPSSQMTPARLPSGSSSLPTIPATWVPRAAQASGPSYASPPTPQPGTPLASGPYPPMGFSPGGMPSSAFVPSAGAPTPSQAGAGEKNGSLRKRLFFGGLALLIILASLTAVLFGVILNKHPTTSQTVLQSVLPVTQGSVTSFGTRTLSSLPALKNTPPQAQLTLPTRLRVPGGQASDAAANLRQLPALPLRQSATLGTEPSQQNTSLVPSLRTQIPGQEQVGLDSPADTAVAAYGGMAMLDAVDGVFVVDTHTTRYAVSFADFFAPMLHSQEFLGQPRILFDIGTSRWIVVMNQVRLNGTAVAAGFFDVAFSATNDPSSDWFLYQLSTRVAAYGGCTWGDYPQIGTDVSGLFITGTIFACGQSGELHGVALWDLQKSNFALGMGGSCYEWTGFKTAAGDSVVTLTPAAQEPLDKTEWLLSNDAGYVDAGRTSTHVMVWAVEDAAGDSKTAPLVENAAVTLAHPYADPPSAIQPNTAAKLNTGDARIEQVQFTKGHLFTAFTTALNWAGGAATRSGIYWLDLVPSLQSATGQVTVQVAQQGLFGFSQGYLFNPFFVSDGLGNAFLFAEAAGQDLYPSLVFASHLRKDAPNTLGQTSGAFLLDTGKTAFTGSHWGDYRGGCSTMADGNRTLILYVGLSLSGTTTQWQSKVWALASYP